LHLCKSTASTLKRFFHAVVFRTGDFLTPPKQPASPSDLGHVLAPTEGTDPRGRTAKTAGERRNRELSCQRDAGEQSPLAREKLARSLRGGAIRAYTEKQGGPEFQAMSYV